MTPSPPSAAPSAARPRLGILQTGQTDPQLKPEHGDYGAMFDRLIEDAGGGFDLVPYRVFEGVFPPAIDACDAWLITGSKYGVYDDQPWIAPLGAFLRSVHAESRPMVGICFGHQVLAHALGGRAEKAAQGWGLGVHHHELTQIPGERPAWLPTDRSTLALNVVHQDQVTAIPDHATVLAASDFCPFAALQFGDSAISFQGHPEFSPAFEAALLDRFDGDKFPADRVAEARQTLAQPLDSDRVGQAIHTFLRYRLGMDGDRRAEVSGA